MRMFVFQSIEYESDARDLALALVDRGFEMVGVTKTGKKWRVTAQSTGG